MSCSSCFSGAIHTGNPTGSTTTLHGLPVYVALPRDGSTPKGVVVMIPDAFGWDFVNNRLLCDAYAEKGGWLVYLPDFMGGAYPTSTITRPQLTKPRSFCASIFR
jgi:dienelactone hydrolase